MTMANTGFVANRFDGRKLWRLLSKASPAVKVALNYTPPPKEFLYRYPEGGPFTRDTLPPLLYTTLPHLTDTPEEAYFALKEDILARPAASLSDQYRFLFSLLMKRFDKKMWIERSGGSLSTLPALLKHFPNAKYVHVTRDGRDVAMSIAKHPPTRLFAYNWMNTKKYGIDILRPPFILGTNPVLSAVEPLLTPLLGMEQLRDKPMAPADIGRFWSEMVEVGFESIRRIPTDNILTMRYEDLIAAPRETLIRFMDFIDPDLTYEEWLDEAEALPRPGRQAWRDLPPDELKALDAACAKGMAITGYEMS